MSLRPEEERGIASALAENGFSKALEPHTLKKLIASFEVIPTIKRETIIKQGEAADLFYIVGAGMFAVYINIAPGSLRIGTLEFPEFFGEIALIIGCTRTACVVCEEDGVVYALRRKIFTTILMNSPKIADFIQTTATRRQVENKRVIFEDWKRTKKYRSNCA